MIRSLWIAKTGLEAQQTKLDVITNNLANAGTHGYKKSNAVFQDLLYQTVRQPGAPASEQTQLPSGLQLGTGVKAAATVRTFTQGNLQQSGNPLDVAINGAGFFAVALPDGTTGYTRDGNLQLNGQGQLVTATGYPVQPGLTIPANAKHITIAADGTVSALLPGQSASQTLGQIQLANFANPAGLLATGDNLFAETSASGSPQSGAPGADGLGRLEQGMTETSNVNVVEELVNMIQTQRAYEINSKAIQSADQMLQRLGQL